MPEDGRPVYVVALHGAVFLAIRAIEEYGTMAETFQKETERLKAACKDYMKEHSINVVEVDGRCIRLQKIHGHRLDIDELKRLHPVLYQKFSKPVDSLRLILS